MGTDTSVSLAPIRAINARVILSLNFKKKGRKSRTTLKKL